MEEEWEHMDDWVDPLNALIINIHNTNITIYMECLLMNKQDARAGVY